eukprot:TRINITY_DN14681_c0_g1_i1.p1 TRINITY_DN14681_c0_g1~~TRINITY_DN14681_c0_g1_i1.p1  ORF type:complete len:144 (+),score=28.25 TRINITY_DN14681_c0_g1_i1:140-571(+)
MGCTPSAPAATFSADVDQEEQLHLSTASTAYAHPLHPVVACFPRARWSTFGAALEDEISPSRRRAAASDIIALKEMSRQSSLSSGPLSQGGYHRDLDEEEEEEAFWADVRMGGGLAGLSAVNRLGERQLDVAACLEHHPSGAP